MDIETAAEIAALPSIQALPLRKRFFALAYIRSQNGARSAEEAGYKPGKKAGAQLSVQAGRLLRDETVALAVREGLALKWRALVMQPDEVLARVARIARHDHRRVEQASSLADLDDDTAEAVQGIKRRIEYDKHGERKAETIEIKVASKLQALELLAKYHRLLQPDVAGGDLGVAFAEAMDRASRRAALRDAAAGAEDAIVGSDSSSPESPEALRPPAEGVASAAVDQFAEGSER